jgi:hypothetical protein
LRGILMGLALLFGSTPGRAQELRLEDAAARARQAWMAHDAVALVAESPSLLVQLPGADPSVALGPDQAAALLRDFFAQAQEVECEVRAAREVEPGRGYVELRRGYRIPGTQETRTQSLLLGYRHGKAGWVLVELRVVG